MVDLTTGELSPENRVTLDLLVRSVDLAEGFTLFLARCNIPVLRQTLIADATQQLAALGASVVEVAFDTEITNLRARLAAALATAALKAAAKDDGAPVPAEMPIHQEAAVVAEPAGRYAVPRKYVLFVTGLENSIAYQQPNSRILAELNLERDLFRRDAPVPLVLWLPDYVVTAVARRAPDFWAWRSGVFEFTAAEEDRASATTQLVREGPDNAALLNLTREAKLVRRRQLESLLDDYRDSPSDDRVDAERAEILSDLGSVCEALQDLSCALDHYNRALEIYERLGDVRLRAVTLGKIADVLQARGEWDEALRIRREEQLPVYERLGDVRSRAMILVKIVDVLQARGELDEALHTLQDEALPAFERLGDVRSWAVTLGKIADVLQARGELDEALRIRREEELPTYERLGDVRSRAMTLGKIADLLQVRGEWDEAVRTLQDEVLLAFERLGDLRSRAVTLGKIADVLQAQGELGKALRIRWEEELPTYERLGDVRERAVTLGKIANILQARGEWDEALRTLQDGVLPTFERLGSRLDLLVGRTNLAINLLQRGAPGDQEEARHLLNLALADAHAMRIPEAGQIEAILHRMGE